MSTEIAETFVHVAVAGSDADPGRLSKLVGTWTVSGGVASHGSPTDRGGVEGMDYITSRDGTRIAYERSGSGPVVVLVASALADRRDAKRLARRLSERFTVLNYDRRGRGASGDTGPYRVAREVEDIDALIDVVGGSASIFGSSSGAVLALEAANVLGGKVTRLVLFEPPFITDNSRGPLSGDDARAIEQHLAAGRRGDAVKQFMTRHLGMPAAVVSVMQLLPTWFKLKKLAHTLPYDLELMKDTQSGAPLPTDRWTSVGAPMLVLTGEKSDEFLHSAARALVDVLPAASHETLAGANHAAVVAAPKKLAAAVAEFLEAGG